MRQVVKDNFFAFSKPLEGYLSFMYADVKNLVTTGMGNLIDPIGAALVLPWKKPDGSLASQQEITDAWNAVKARTDLNQRGGRSYMNVTNLRLTDADINNLVQSKMSGNDAILRRRFPTFDSWPADAQLALHSMSWALGPNFNYPKFVAAVTKVLPDFVTAATESHIGEAGNPGIIPRNKANFNLFMSAADVLSNNKDPDQLYGFVQAGTTAAKEAAQALAEKKTPMTGATSLPNLIPTSTAGKVAATVGGAAIVGALAFEYVPKWLEKRKARKVAR